MWCKGGELWHRKCFYPSEITKALEDCRQALKDKNLSRCRQGLPWFTLIRAPRQTTVVSIVGTSFAVTAKILIGERETNKQRAMRFVRNLRAPA